MRLPDDQNPLDTEFPLGDGIAETTASVYCPYCNETVEIAIDPGGGASQEYVEDCAVCCRPIVFTLIADADGNLLNLETRCEND